MKTILLTIFTLLTLGMQCQAQVISSHDAWLKALRFAEGRRTAMAKGDGGGVRLTEVCLDGMMSHDGGALYCYNISDGGFVFVGSVGGDACVIGYADKGCIDTANMPEAMRLWMESVGGEVLGERGEVSDVRSSISPIVECEWSQTEPYNLQCPKNGSKYTVTGCVATAMAQALYSIQPAGCAALDAYTTKTIRLKCDALPATTFNWQLLQTTYTERDKGAAADEIARLMRYCGQATEMDYSSASGTPAENVIYALRGAFNLSNSCHQIFRQDYTLQQWENIIYGELSARRPVIICGNTTTEGHAFVCDGYDSNGLYHINWGWNGSCNGYFIIDALSPYHSGTGSSNDGYSNDITALIGLKLKSASEETVSTLKAMEVISYQQSIDNRFGKDHDFTFSANIKLKNMNRTAKTMEVCWGLYDEQGRLLQVADTHEFLNIASNATGTCSIRGDVGRNCDDGNYRIMPLARQSGAKEWTPCEYEANASFMMTISGNSCFMQKMRNAYDYQSYTASSVSIGGNLVSCYTQCIEATVSNLGTSHVGTLYVLVDGRLRRTLSVGIDPGETGIIRTYINLGAGSHTVSVASAPEGTTDYTVLCSASATVSQEQYCMLSQMDVSVLSDSYLDGRVWIVSDPSAVIACDLANTNATPYNSDIRLYVNDGAFDDRTYNIYANVPANGSSRVFCTIDNMSDGRTYTIRPVIKRGSTDWAVYNNGIKVKYDSTTAIHQHTAHDSRSGAVYTIDGRRISATSALPHGIYIMNGKKITK